MRHLPCLLALLSISAPAATITPVQTNPVETDLSVVLDQIYGSGNYFRIDDDLDQLGQPGLISVRALATFAGARETLGYCTLCDGSDDVYFDQSFSIDGVFSTPLTVNGVSNFFMTEQFSWFDYAQYPPFTGMVYSDPSRNPAGMDHMVTYGVSGLPNTYVLAFDDWISVPNPNSDRDYQDLVVEVTYVSGPPDIQTPEPGAVLTLLGGLAALAFIRRKRSAANGK